MAAAEHLVGKLKADAERAAAAKASAQTEVARRRAQAEEEIALLKGDLTAAPDLVRCCSIQVFVQRPPTSSCGLRERELLLTHY